MEILEDFDKPEWHRHTPSFLKRTIRLGLCDLLVLVLVLFSAETGLHFYKGAESLRFNEDYTGGHPICLNSQRLREDGEVKERPPGQIRILATGNSITFGSGVAWDRTYPKQLNRILQENEGLGRYFVINAGGQGATMNSLINEVPRQCSQFEPDIVTLGLTCAFVTHHMNLKTTMPSAQESHGRLKTYLSSLIHFPFRAHVFLFQNTRIYPFIDRYVRMLFYRLGIMEERLYNIDGSIISYAFDVKEIGQKRFEAIKNAYSDIEKSLIEFEKKLDERNIKLVVVIIPDRFLLSDAPVDNLRRIRKKKMRIDPTEKFVEFCKKQKYVYVNVRSRLEEERKLMLSGEKGWNDLYITDDCGHLNDMGHQITAEEIYKVMKSCNMLAQQKASLLENTSAGEKNAKEANICHLN
jgi:hypothetical protein